VADEKKQLRALMSEARDALSVERAASLSDKLQRNLIESAIFARARTLALYSPIDNEVATGLILDRAIASNRIVLFPRLDRAAGTLVLARISGAEELVVGAFGIREPAPGASIVDPSSLDSCLVIVPGLAFSHAGGRIGRGGGHYDRLLEVISPQAVSVGLAYSFQLLDRVPQSGRDRRLNYIVTESGLIRAQGRRAMDGGIWDQGGIPR
jgi:5-formyltetrahydrofolate cyclo-ligase